MIQEIPRTLYKYLRREHAEDMLVNGKIRIGTLYEYRGYQDAARKDAKEAVKSAYTNIDRPVRAIKNEHLPGLFKKLINIQGGTVELLSGSLDEIYVFVDVYMYCMSKISSKTLMKDFGCDTCVKIANPNAFILSITGQMKEFTTQEPFGGQCVYMDRRKEARYPNEIPLYLIKETRYASQQEFRVIWYPNDGRQREPISKIRLLNTGQTGSINEDTFWQPSLQKDQNPISHKFISCKQATRYCSLIKF